LEVSEDGQSIRVRLIPRLDFTADGAKDGKRKSTKNPRPPQRLFNPKDVDKSDKSLAKSKGYWIWGADMFDKNGYLEKEMKLPGLSMGDVSPSLEELSRFSSANGAPGEFNGMASALSEIDAQAPRAAVESLSTFKPGDKVRITTGELLNAQGVIKSVDKSLITLDMNDNLLGEIQIESSKLEKCFTVGDQIKVVRGKFQGEIGMIVKVGDNTASVFSGTKKQFDVFLKDIQGLMAHQPLKSSAQSEGPFKLHDILVFK
jgi:transcription elongation factor SPT5